VSISTFQPQNEVIVKFTYDTNGIVNKIVAYNEGKTIYQIGYFNLYDDDNRLVLRKMYFNNIFLKEDVFCDSNSYERTNILENDNNWYSYTKIKLNKGERIDFFQQTSEIGNPTINIWFQDQFERDYCSFNLQLYNEWMYGSETNVKVNDEIGETHYLDGKILSNEIIKNKPTGEIKSEVKYTFKYW
ncbi:MAG TPA: hypothetical protein VK808_01425, partial [Bacteroidia bacterium]|nr:hypothetical protein [Bacteroidia bacterium]